jgi:two-component system response regulator (stage 0 sporulation protein F)
MIQNKYDPKSDGDLSQESTATEKAAPRVLLAEDHDEMRRLLAQELHAAGYDVIQCRDGMGFLAHLESFIINKGILDFELIISDILMPGLTGLEIFEDLHEYKGFPPTILITAFGDENTRRKAKQLGAAAMFDKPFEIDDLLSKVREVMPPHTAYRR